MKNGGYTLIELAIVVFLLGLMLSLAVPRVRDALTGDDIKTTARRIMGAVRELRTDAIRDQVDYVLYLDLDGSSFWTYSRDMTPEKKAEMRKGAFHFPKGVRLADISQIGAERKSEGGAEVIFFKKGHIQPTVIHLTKADRSFTLLISPFSSAVKVYESYVDVTPGGRENR